MIKIKKFMIKRLMIIEQGKKYKITDIIYVIIKIEKVG